MDGNRESEAAAADQADQAAARKTERVERGSEACELRWRTVATPFTQWANRRWSSTVGGVASARFGVGAHTPWSI